MKKLLLLIPFFVIGIMSCKKEDSKSETSNCPDFNKYKGYWLESQTQVKMKFSNDNKYCNLNSSGTENCFTSYIIECNFIKLNSNPPYTYHKFEPIDVNSLYINGSIFTKVQ